MDYSEQNQLGIFDTINHLKVAFGRYWMLSFPPALVVCVLALGVAVKLPSYYSSSFTIYIQPQQINTSLVGQREQRQVTEKFDALIQELVSRPRLLSIIQKFDLYPQYQGLTGQEKALKRFQSAYQIQTLQSVLGRSGEHAAPTFRVSFSHSDRDKSYRVADELLNVFVQESLIDQRSETRGTEEFISTRLKEAQQKLERIEQKRQDYVRKNAGKLPERRERAIMEQRDAQAKLSANSQMIAANVARVRYLEQELQMTIRDPATATHTGGSAVDLNVDPEASLQQQKQALAILQSRYSSKHPDVIALQNRIKLLEERGVKSTSSSSGGMGFGNTRESRMIRREISELQVQTEVLRGESSQLQASIDKLGSEIDSIPVKEQELIEIERDYAMQKSIYDKLMLDREQASLQSSLIESQRGNRFKTIESPAKPEMPAGPPRLLIALGGVVTGLAVFTLIPVAFFFLNTAFKFRKEAESVLGLPVLGVIPPIETPAVAIASRRAFSTSFLTSVVTFVFGVVLIIIFI
ncbi:MAG TPA: hypothetical protein PKA63_02325 [Oligoflexia bacterium]|nr:hypothetical protein [Oligoflexia bacterium]HMP47487.1 hypothetical protein [Oligoflexia bacterium]